MKKYLKLTSILLIATLLISSLLVSTAVAEEEQKPWLDIPWDKIPEWPWDDKSPSEHLSNPTNFDLYFNAGWYSTRMWNPDKQTLARAVTGATGVDLTLLTPAGSGTEKLNAMIAAGDLPDIISGLASDDPQVSVLRGSRLVYPLDELIDKYAPEYWDIIPQAMVDWYTAEDGHWYEFPGEFWAKSKMTEQNYLETNAHGMFVDKRVMDQLGIDKEAFTTKEGTIEALKKVKEADLTYKGVEVDPPLLIGAYGLDGTWEDNASGMFAIPREDEEGKLIYRRRHPKYLEMMKFANRLFREGLISQQNMAMSTKRVDEKLMGGGYFAYLGPMGGAMPEAAELVYQDPPKEWIPVGPIRAADEARPEFPAGGAGWPMTYITKSCDEPGKAIRWLLWQYNNPILMYYGVEGITYTWNEDKDRIVWTEERVKTFEEGGWLAEMQKYGHRTIPYWSEEPAAVQRVQPKPATKSWAIYDSIIKYNSKFTYDVKPFSGLAPQTGKLASLNSQINEYWESQMSKMIMAKSPERVEEIWKKSIDHIEKLGFEKIYEHMNEKFQENKEKLGLEYAWPPNREE